MRSTGCRARGRSGRGHGRGLLCSERVGHRGGLGDGQGSARVRHGRVVGRLGPGLGLLPVTIDILLESAKVQGTKLDGGPVDLAVARHANSLLLVKQAAAEVRGAGGGALSSLEGGGGVTTGGSARSLLLSLVLLL